ncbi:hypothetical protein [Marinicella litoralis]|uniref:Lipoprotein n=1 Tax=Marinicella litoralis TaxID=644220 RepID=A0A4R6XC53_9GAMM|nr:hypothetical protein [Marinicella litoralis]TDR16855.1 hypothetical protein C8D91_2762 [Marinicella litoralis]
MYKKLMLAVTCVALTACGADEATTNTSTTNLNDHENSVADEAPRSALKEYLSEGTVCDVLDQESLRNTFGIQTEIKARVSSFSNKYTCSFSWERADADERMNAMISGTVMTADGKMKKIPMRQRVTDSELSITLSQSDRSAENYLPRKKTEQELQTQIDAAKKAANDRLTDEQKAAAGDVANDMVEKLLKKNNENQIIEGVGQAAYWSRVGFGGLNVFTNGVEVYIAPMIADTQEEDIENAKLAFQLLQQ